MPNRLPAPLKTEQVFAQCASSIFSFRTTKSVKASDSIISQDRAVRAIELGLGIKKPGYNIYVSGQEGVGKSSVIKAYLEKWSKNSAAPMDWIYVFNFENEKKARAISLEPGQGHKLKKHVETTIKELQIEIAEALESEDYENAVNLFLSLNGEKQAKKYDELETIAARLNFTIKSTKMGIETIPRIEGKEITDEDYNKLSVRKRNRIEKDRSLLEPQVLNFARKIRDLELDAKTYVNELQVTVAQDVIETNFEHLYKRYGKNKHIATHLKQMNEDIIEHLMEFIGLEEPSKKEEEASHNLMGKDILKRYMVNLFLDNRNCKGAPIVIESNPNYYNLFGKVEKNVDHGVLLTDFLMIQSGSIHKANGGYLVIEANDILKAPMVWDSLKKVLKNRQAFIEDLGEQYSMLPTANLRPEPIPLDVKVILMGTDEIFYMLHELDDEFAKIFKIKADFDSKMPRNKSNIHSYLSFIGTRVQKEELLDFDKEAVSAIVEYGSRLVDHQKYLSTQFSQIKDVTIEADYIARELAKKTVNRNHVEQAISEKHQRHNLMETDILSMIKTRDYLLSFKGKVIGQINALVVYELAHVSFGKVCRITCTTSSGHESILCVEKTCKLTGKSYDKSVSILTGFLHAILAKDKPLGLAARLCFEQSYGYIDGDSATAAELIAIISAFSEIPILQNFAITGSVNQFGEIQPIGGVNEKIEGFYRACLTNNKDAQYGVIIPKQNMINLMLAPDAREGVKKGKLKIYPVSYFYEAFELMTQTPLGIRSVYDKKTLANSAISQINKRMNKLSENNPACSHH